MEDHPQRKVNLYTTNKIYSGYIDIQSDSIRTIDHLNNHNLYWRDPSEKLFSDSILLRNASVVIEGDKTIGKFPKLQLRIDDIIFFSDVLDESGDFSEKIRAKAISAKSHERETSVRIFTHMQGDSFFLISGIFYGLLRGKSQHRYLPVTHVEINEIVRSGNHWNKKPLNIGNHFIGLSTEHIESCSLIEKTGMPA